MKASTQRSGTESWLKIAYLVIATLLTILAYKVGSIWVGHAVLILLLFPASWFVEPQARRLLRSFLIFIFASLLLATACFQFLST